MFESKDAASSILEDRIEYSLPLGILGKVFSQTMVKKKLKEIFEYRDTITNQDISIHNNSVRWKTDNNNIIPMIIFLQVLRDLLVQLWHPFLLQEEIK